MSLLILDIDFFKMVNDTYSHPAGDTVLKCVADIIRVSNRTTDIAARYGDEEFVEISPETDATQKIRLTPSIGAGTGHARSEKDQFLQETDKALYRVKAEGHNRTKTIS